MFPSGHSKNQTADLDGIMKHKFSLLGGLCLDSQKLVGFVENLMNLDNLENSDL